MPVSSHIVEEHHGKGRGHTSHGNGKGLGHLKHADDAMADGVYTMEIGGIFHDNDGTTNQTSVPVTLADGSTLTTEARQGSIDSTDQGLRLETDSGNGRLRLNVVFDADNRIALGDLSTLSFDFVMDELDPNSDARYSPAFRLLIDGDGNLATTADRGELVFEYAYQGSDNVPQVGAVPLDTTVHADLAGDDWVAWQRSNNANRDVYPDIVPLSDWADADGYTPVGGVEFDENSLVLGYSIGLGSGPGSGVAYIENAQVGGVTYDFIA